MTIALALALSITASAGPDPAHEWASLVEEGDLGAAKARCEAWLNAPEVHTRAEAHKCLANVEVGLASRAAIDANVERRAGADARLAATRRALRHLDEAIELAPGDLTIHQGRLHLLRGAGLMAELTGALEDSIRRHPGRDWLPSWLAYPIEYYRARRFEQALLLYRVLDRHFPDDHVVLSNMGATLANMRRDAEALGCFERAVKLSPEDPTDSWNLAVSYDGMGRIEEADRAYGRALALVRDDAARVEATCRYAEFLEKRRGDRRRACELQRKGSCAAQTACPGVPATNDPGGATASPD